MNEIAPLNPRDGGKLDHLLREALPGPDRLPGDFEDRVMDRLRASLTAGLAGRRTSLVMALYWSLAGLAAAWLIWLKQGALTPQGYSFLGVLLPTIALSLAAVWLLLRQSRLRLTDVFLRTLQ